MSRIEISKKLVLINSASSLATRMLSLSVLVWLQQYLLKRISAEEYSLLPLLYSIMAFAPLITTVLTGGLGRFITVAYARDDDEEVTRIVSTMFPILCGAGLLFLVGGWTFAWYIDRLLDIAPERVWDARIMMAILMFSAAVRLPLAPFGAGFFVRQKFVLENLIQVGTELFRLTLLFTLLFGVSTRVLWVITASTVAELVNLTITRSVSMRLVPALRFRIKAIHWPIAKEITSFGGWQFVAQLADTMRTSADAIILNKLATPLDMTCYHLGSLPWRHVKQASATLRSPLTPALMSMYAAADYDRIRNTYYRTGRWMLWFVMFFAVPLAVFHRQLVLLYVGSEFAPAGTVMLLLVLTFPMSYGNVLMPTLAQAYGQVKQQALRLVVVHTFNLAATLVLVGYFRMGAVGSALGTFVAWLLLQPMLHWPLGLSLARASWGEWMRKCLGPGCLPAVAAALVAAPIAGWAPLESWAALFAGVCVVSAVYLVVLWAGCLQAEDVRDAARVMSAIRSRWQGAIAGAG